ncbi:uncharacterized protein LOC107217941 [Neodiprion lecontei]|uniref:Uncharacterized protein LOC107217941 n=1 Tax=Neodiprion lecontei TaxID=441921 RepID=A0A6J0BAE5_NEOLC|nr:uncharacterized protein LOC107217941 [Neodiprion lecontei]
MIRFCNRRWAAFVCILAVSIGVLHGMSHVEFYEYYSKFLDDIDRLCELSVDYISYVITRLLSSKKTDKLQMVNEHYNLMVQRARPLFTLFDEDIRRLIIFTDNLESIEMVKKFLYSYFRQSAINLIDHLKRVYNL